MVARGRPTVMTPQVMTDLRKALVAGLSRRKAAALAGIGWSTFTDHVRSDPDFSDQVERWEAEGCLVHASVLVKAAAGRPISAQAVAASKFYLQTHDREAWNPAQHHVIEGLGTVMATLTAMPDAVEASDRISLEGPQ